MTKIKKVKASAKKDFIEKHWGKIVIAILLLVPFIYFAPFLSANRMITGSDYLLGAYPSDKWTAEQEDLPLWYPQVFGGVPVFGAPVGGPLAPLAQLREIIPPQVVLALTFMVFFFLAGLGMYLYLKEIGLSPYSAAVGAVAYQFIGNLATTPYAGHAGRAASIATFPLMLFFAHRAIKSKKLQYFIVTGLVTAFTFYEGHFQITYYGLLFIFGYFIYYLIAHRKEYSKRDVAKTFAYGLCAIGLIFLLMAAVWLPVLGGLKTAARGVERGYGYATSWSLSPFELVDLAIPTFSGLLNNYWGLNYFKLNLDYAGILPVILTIFTILIFWKKPYVKFYTGCIIVSILIALGSYTPFFRIPYFVIPGFKLFRAPSLVFYLASFSFIVLATIGFDNIFVKNHKKVQKGVLKKKFFTIAGILLAIFIIGGIICAGARDSIIRSIQDSIYPKIVAEYGPQVAKAKISNLNTNYSQFIQGVWRSLIFIVVIISMIYLSTKRKIKLWVFAVAAVAISLIDQLPLVAKFLPSGPSPETYYAADDVVKYLKKDHSIFRVFPLQYEHANDLYLLYHNIQSAGGYISNPIQRYQDFIGAGTSVMFNPSNLLQYPYLLDMLNIKYIIAPILPEDISQYDHKTQNYINKLQRYFSRFNLVYSGYKYSIYLNDSVLPRAYMVPKYEVCNNSKLLLDKLKLRSFDPCSVVMIEEDPQISYPNILDPNKDSLSYLMNVHIAKYSANKIVCNTDSPYPCFLVLADNWHPDWRVKVDGVLDKLYRVNYTFRAVFLEAGRHEVIFEYHSSYFSVGLPITIISLLFSITLCFLAVKFNL